MLPRRKFWFPKAVWVGDPESPNVLMDSRRWLLAWLLRLAWLVLLDLEKISAMEPRRWRFSELGTEMGEVRSFDMVDGGLVDGDW
jgi:hypothetical protein